MRAHLECPKRRPVAERREAQGARVVPYCYLDVAATDQTESAQSYSRYGAAARVIKAVGKTIQRQFILRPIYASDLNRDWNETRRRGQRTPGLTMEGSRTGGVLPQSVTTAFEPRE